MERKNGYSNLTIFYFSIAREALEQHKKFYFSDLFFGRPRQEPETSRKGAKEEEWVSYSTSYRLLQIPQLGAG